MKHLYPDESGPLQDGNAPVHKGREIAKGLNDYGLDSNQILTQLNTFARFCTDMHLSAPPSNDQLKK